MNRRFAAGFAAFALLLVVLSPLRLVGDGHEYVGMAVSIVTLGSAAPAPEELEALEQRLAADGVPMFHDALHEGSDGRLHFRHFWMYSALAAPFVGVVMLLDAHPAWGFTLLNIALLSAAAGLLAARAGGLPTAFLFVGPIIWWIDKAHPEAFVFALMVGGFALLDDQPGGALIAWGLAAAQYPPLVLLPVLGLAGVLWQRPESRTDRRFLAAAAGAFAVAALHPALSLWRLGVVSPLVFWGAPATLPGWRAWTAVYTDLNIGLLVNFPFLAVVTVLLVVRHRRLPQEKAGDTLGSESVRRRAWGATTALAAALLLPFAFAQTTNVNHGGTPGISRYALWLIPLAVPLLLAASGRHKAPPGWLAATVAVSIAWCLLYYHPARAESYEEPTRAAAVVWRYAPRLSSPLPEVFAERLTHRAPGLLPIATPSCSKVLLIEGAWPAPCSPAATMPESCRQPAALCYADRRFGRPGGYRFQHLSESVPRAHARNRAVWPAAIEERVAALLTELRWWEMVPAPPPAESILRAAERAGWTTALSGPGRAFVYASSPRQGGILRLRPAQPMRGTVVAMVNGAVLREIESPTAAGEAWTVRLPPIGEPGVALLLRATTETAR